MTSSHEKYKLSAERHEAVYRIIERLSFLDTTPKEYPQAIILGGQPGAGKSRLLDYSFNEIPGHNAVKINGDDFRQWHPRINDILLENEASMAQHTDPDVRVWTKRLFDTAIETRRNVIFEGTMRVRDAISATMSRLRSEGYHVTARVVAAHERQSVAGIFSRYEAQKKESGHGRMAPLPIHDQAYIGMLDTIDNIEVNCLADRIQVFNRSGNVIYDAKLLGGVWDNPGAMAAIEQERNRIPTILEARALLADWKNIIILMKERGASKEELSVAREVASNHISNIHPVLSSQENIAARVIDMQMADSITGNIFESLEASRIIDIEFGCDRPKLNNESFDI